MQPRTSPSPKTTAPSASIKGFCSCQPSVGVRFNFALFAPRVLPSTLLAAQYRSQSVILNTHRDTPANYRRLCLLDRDSKTQLQALRLEGKSGGGCAVVNCELKTVNRIWSSRRSGACCMDLGRQQKHINWIDCFSFTLPLLLLLHQGAQLAANRLIS